MTQFQGFKTEKQARDFIKKNGGMLTTCKPTKTGRKPASYNDYMLAVNFGGLNKEKYPYCVQWNI